MPNVWLLTNFIAVLLLPPANCLLLAGVGCCLLKSRPRLAKSMLWVAGIALWLFSLPLVAVWLTQPLQGMHPVWDGKTTAEAIVVLGSGRYRGGPEFGGADDVTARALERLRYGAILARQLKLPILLTGGNPDGGGRSEAEAMRVVLQRDFGLTARWLETASDNTRENAIGSARLLRQAGVRKILLVTHAWHMPRAAGAFAVNGLEVVPAPMGYAVRQPLSPLDFIPRADALRLSSHAMHEWIGLLWYAIRS